MLALLRGQDDSFDKRFVTEAEIQDKDVCFRQSRGGDRKQTTKRLY